MSHADRFDIDSEIIMQEFRDYDARNSGYADTRCWHKKGITERDTARDLLDNLGYAGVELRSHPPGEDPPDCVAWLPDGRRIAIEVTELVNTNMRQRHAWRRKAEWRGVAPPEGAAGVFDVADWDVPTIGERISERLNAKDIPPTERKGGPYDTYLLAIHTDEVMITHELLTQVMSTAEFRSTWVDAAFVVMSYDPHTEGCPVVQVPLRSW